MDYLIVEILMQRGGERGRESVCVCVREWKVNIKKYIFSQTFKL